MIEHVIEARRRDLGGFEVGRVLPHGKRRSVGPFVFFDHMGPLEFAPGIPRSMDVRPHPHIGLSTVTYLFDGEIMHRDSLGSEQAIRPGEVNWMTAGSGITHSERFERARREGGPMHGIQAWVAFARELEETVPEFDHYAGADLPEYESGGLWARLVAGEAFGAKAAVRTHSPLFYVHWTSGSGGARPTRGALSGTGGVCRRRFGRGRRYRCTTRARCSCSRPDNRCCSPRSQPAVVMLLGGEPIGERFIEWNFVSSSKARIEEAKADWRAGRMKLPVHDDAEFIPLPADPPPPANPMS